MRARPPIGICRDPAVYAYTQNLACLACTAAPSFVCPRAHRDAEDERTALKARGGDVSTSVEEVDPTNQAHVYKTLWNQKVAGFTLHTFSEDYSTLTTDYVSYTGETIHSFSVTKGVPPSPTPTPGPNELDELAVVTDAAGKVEVTAWKPGQ